MEIKNIVVGPISTKCYILSSGEKIAVIDPGGDSEKILEAIRKEKGELEYIINTHFHFDHTLSNRDIVDSTGAQVLIHEAEKDYIDFTPSKFLRDGDIIEIGEFKLKIIHTPGHTPGGICLLGDNEIFTGDTLFRNTHGRTDLPGGSEEKMQESLEKLKSIIKPGMTVYPGHGKIFVAE